MASTTPTESSQPTSIPSSSAHTTPSPSPLLLLSSMSNLMSIKLDYTNYIPWKHQLITILEAYSLIEHIDGTTLKPSPFVLDTTGNPTSVVNPDFQSWNIKDKALLSLINSTLTPQVFSLVVGITNSRKVWNTLEQRFTSTLRANILNLKLELQSLKKGNDSVNSFLQKIKVARDKLLAVGVVVDNEELICIVLKGLPRDFAHFCSAIRTRSDPISYEQLAIMLQSKEQAIMEHTDSIPHSLALHLIANQMATLRIDPRIMDLEEDGVETTLTEEEVEVDSTPMEVNITYLRCHKVFLLILIKIQHLLMLQRLIDLHVRSVGNLDILPWTVTTE